MPSPDKLFRLDPVETKITAPVSNFQVLAEAADRSVANRSLDRGLAAFSQTLGGLAQFKKQQQIRDDIKTAKDAAVRGEVMPNVLPVAEAAYRNVIDKNTSAESLLAIDRWENGDEFNALIKSETPSDQKTSQIEASYDDFYARAVQSMQNPDLIQNLRLTVNALKEKSYQKVYQRERDLRTIEGIHGLKNTLGESKRFAEATGIPLIDTLTPNWLQANAKDLGKSHPYLSLSERKLLAFQTLTTDQEVLADPQIIEEIMKSKYNKGFTFRNLYEGQGDDATEFQKIYNAYVTNSKAYFKKLDDDATASEKANIAQFKDTIRQKYIGAGLTSAKGISKEALDSGLLDEAKANKLEKDTQKYMDTNIKFQEGSAEDVAMVDFILNQGVTLPTQIDALVLEGRLNPELATKYKSYLKEENKQKLAFIGKYKEQVRDIAKNVLSLSKLTLKNKLKDIFSFTGREPTMSELLMAMNGSGLPAKQVNLIIQQVQDLHNGLNSQAEKMGIQASIADRADGAVPPESLQKFQLIVESQVLKLSEAIKQGLEPRPVKTTPPLTMDDFPLVVKQTENIFDTDPQGATIDTASSTFTFDSGLTFKPFQNLNLKAIIMDAGIKGYPQPLADVVAQMVYDEAEQKKQANPELYEAIRKKQETLDNIDTWFSDLGEDLGMIPGFLKEVLTPGLDMKTGKMRVPYADLSPEKQKELIQRKRDNLDNIDKSIVDSGKNLLNLMKSMVGVSEAEGATTSQDADFDPDAKGPRGFTGPASKPLAVKPEEAKGSTGEYPQYGEQYTGGTSEESDIEGFLDEDTGEEVDMPPVVMDEIVVSEKAQPSALSGLPKETQEDIKRQLEGKGVTHTKPSSFKEVPFKPKKVKSKIKRDRDVIIKKAELGDNDKRKYGTKPYLSYASWESLGKPARALTSINQLPPSNSNSIKSGATIGYGHDILKSEIGSGKIHGVPFLNRDGTFKNLTEQQLDIIFQKDIKIAEKAASKDYSKLPNMPAFKSLPNSVQIYMTDIWFNMGKLKTEFPKGLGALEVLNMIKTNPNIKPTPNNRLQEIITLSQQSTVGGAISWNNTDMTKNIKRLLEVFKVEIIDRGGSPEGVKKRAKDLWNSLPIEKDLRSFMGAN